MEQGKKPFAHRAHYWVQPKIREPFNGLSHGFGAVLSFAGLIALIAATVNKPVTLLGVSVYGGSLVLLFIASTLYHSLHVSEHGVRKLMIFDQVAIFILIAGCWTPVCLAPLKGPWGYTMLAIVWSIALIGSLLRIFWKRSPAWVPVALYLVMGWLAAVVAGPLATALSPAAMAWMFAGGIVYTIGAVIFASKRPRLWPPIFSSHELWHVCVLVAAACHFVMMYFFVIPSA